MKDEMESSRATGAAEVEGMVGNGLVGMARWWCEYVHVHTQAVNRWR